MGRHTGKYFRSGQCNGNSINVSNVKNSASNSQPPLIAIMSGLNRNTVICTVGGKKIQCLLDTGADISCISKSFLDLSTLKNIQLQKSEYPEVSGVGGAKHKILGKFETNIFITKTQFAANFHVVPGIRYPVILGCDFLQQHGVTVDFAENLVTLKNKNDNRVNVKLARSDAGLARINQNTYIPANSRKDVKVKVSRSKSDGIFLIEPCDSLYKKNLAGAKCLVKIKKRRASISIMNVSNESVYLNTDTVIGVLTAVDKEDVFKIEDTNNTTTKSCANERYHTNNPTCANIQIESQEQSGKAINFDLSKSDLTQEQQNEMRGFLNQNRDIFSTSLQDLGEAKGYHHTIDTYPGEGPVRLPYYRANPVQRKAIEEEVNKMLDNKIIRESNSIWHSPVVLVKKRDNTYRFAIDYRSLNRKTRSIAFPLPTIESVFDCIGDSHAQYFSTLDMASGFWQVPLDPKTRHKAAFVVPSGIYEFNRMPFGLKNAPMSFQMLMTKVLGSMNWKQALCFIDDILVFSQTFEQHLAHLDLLFQKLRDANLTLKPEKCHFALEKVKYLGHILSKNGIQVDKEKTKAVDEFPVPTNQRSLRSFLGLCNYYRKFVFKYSQIAAPLNELLQKDRKFIWDSKHQLAFDTLKHSLVTAPMIHYPDMNKTFILTTDASDTALAYILGQKGSDGKERVISYGGRALRSDERKWGVTDKECLAVLEGIRTYRQYLSHRKFIVYTDNKALSWLHKIKDTSSRLGRWSVELQGHDYEVFHRKGKANQNADALSRREYPVEPSVTDPEANKHGYSNHEQPEQVNQEKQDVSAVYSVNIEQVDYPCPALETVLEEQEEIEELERVEVFFNYDRTPSIMKVNTFHKELRGTEDTFQKINNLDEDKDIGNTVESENTEVNSSINNELQNTNSNSNDKFPWETHEISKFQKECEDFKHIYRYLDKGELPKDDSLARKTMLESDHYQISGGVLYHIHETRGKKLSLEDRIIIQVAVPTELRQDLMVSYHDSVAGGCHLGIQRSFAALRYKYYWPKCFQDIENHVRECDVCQRIKVDRHPHQAPLSNMPVNKVFDRWHMDIIGPLPKSKEGFQYILLVVESLSKWCEAIPMDNMEAGTVAKHLFSQVIARYGAPRILVSDRGRNFMSRLVSALCEMFDITRHHTSAYHPQTNSTCERLNSTLEQILRAYVNKEQDNWPAVLPAAMMAIRMSPSTQSTQFSPFYLLFGKEMNLPIDTSLIPKTEMGLDGVVFFDQMFKNLGVAREIAGDNIKIAQEKSKKRYDVKSKTPNFKEGDWVLLRNMKTKKGVSPKLMPKHIGPYFIQGLGPNFTYRLVDVRTQLPMKELVNAARLKLYVKPKPKNVKPTKVTRPVQELKESNTAQSTSFSTPTNDRGDSLHTGKIIRDCHINGKKHYQFEKSKDWIDKDKCDMKDIQEYIIKKASRKPSSHRMVTRSKTREEEQN